MAAAGGKQGRDPARFVYVNRFGSHPCGGVLQLGGRGAKRRWSLGLGARSSQEGPRGAAGGGERPPGPEPRAPAAAAAAAARAGLTQKTLAKKFDFPIPLNEASKIMKKKKKGSVWNRVHKIISRMLEENEKYRLRLKCQGLSSERLSYLWICLPKKIMKSLKRELSIES